MKLLSKNIIYCDAKKRKKNKNYLTRFISENDYYIQILYIYTTHTHTHADKPARKQQQKYTWNAVVIEYSNETYSKRAKWMMRERQNTNRIALLQLHALLSIGFGFVGISMVCSSF